MKGMKNRRWWDGRIVLLWIAGVLVGRAWLFKINPFAVAFVVAVFSEKRNQKGLVFFVLLGMFSSISGLVLVKYVALFSTLLVVEKHCEKWTSRYMRGIAAGVLTGVCNMLYGLADTIWQEASWEMLWLGILECVAVVAISLIYQWGIHFFLYKGENEKPDNEELISLLVIIVTVLYGIPREADFIFSLSGTLGYLLIIYMGYRYGASTGAITGAATGILLSLTGENMVIIGICCLLGVCIGAFRKGGRFVDTLVFLVLGGSMVIFALRDLYGIVELRAMISAAVIFLAIPRCYTERMEEGERDGEEDNFAKEDVRALANHRLEDFSDAFRRLSKSFQQESVERELTERQMEDMFEELSQLLCQECVNCKYCWNRHYAETEGSLRSILWQAGQEGAVSLERVNEEFRCRCIKLEEYVTQAEDCVARAQLQLGWHNRMTENRKIMAEQMSEIAQALKSFTADLKEIEEMPREYKKKVGEALRKEGIHLHRLSVKKRRGHLEISFSGFCQGNQCMTKTDVADILYRATGIMMSPARETRNVLSQENSTMHFREDTRYKALTGLARIAKSGERVSGDNYSFLELQGRGELLMVLADGMGSGEIADRDSGNLIEVLEYLMEAGFEKKSAFRLLNTLFVANYEGRSFTTLDMASVNLHTGECEIMKNGAATTFVKHKEKVEVVVSSALPVGVAVEAEPDVTTVLLEEGDMVIMVSDGVLDGFYERNMTEDAQEDMSSFIEELCCQNPSDMANQILMNALARTSREATDDMSVLVTGIWNKN